MNEDKENEIRKDIQKLSSPNSVDQMNQIAHDENNSSVSTKSFNSKDQHQVMDLNSTTLNNQDTNLIGQDSPTKDNVNHPHSSMANPFFSETIETNLSIKETATSDGQQDGTSNKAEYHPRIDTTIGTVEKSPQQTSEQSSTGTIATTTSTINTSATPMKIDTILERNNMADGTISNPKQKKQSKRKPAKKNGSKDDRSLDTTNIQPAGSIGWQFHSTFQHQPVMVIQPHSPDVRTNNSQIPVHSKHTTFHQLPIPIPIPIPHTLSLSHQQEQHFREKSNDKVECSLNKDTISSEHMSRPQKVIINQPVPRPSLENRKIEHNQSHLMKENRDTHQNNQDSPTANNPQFIPAKSSSQHAVHLPTMIMTPANIQPYPNQPHPVMMYRMIPSPNSHQPQTHTSNLAIKSSIISSKPHNDPSKTNVSKVLSPVRPAYPIPMYYHYTQTPTYGTVLNSPNSNYGHHELSPHCESAPPTQSKLNLVQGPTSMSPNATIVTTTEASENLQQSVEVENIAASNGNSLPMNPEPPITVARATNVLNNSPDHQKPKNTGDNKDRSDCQHPSNNQTFNDQSKGISSTDSLNSNFQKPPTPQPIQSPTFSQSPYYMAYRTPTGQLVHYPAYRVVVRPPTTHPSLPTISNIPTTSIHNNNSTTAVNPPDPNQRTLSTSSTSAPQTPVSAPVIYHQQSNNMSHIPISPSFAYQPNGYPSVVSPMQGVATQHPQQPLYYYNYYPPGTSQYTYVHPHPDTTASPESTINPVESPKPKIEKKKSKKIKEPKEVKAAKLSKEPKEPKEPKEKIIKKWSKEPAVKKRKASSVGVDGGRAVLTPLQRKPRKKKRKSLPASAKQSSNLFCYCRTPYEENKFYIQCDLCDEWYHGNCAHVQEEESDALEKWFCRVCKSKFDVRSVWRPKCGRQGCTNYLKGGFVRGMEGTGDALKVKENVSDNSCQTSKQETTENVIIDDLAEKLVRRCLERIIDELDAAPKEYKEAEKAKISFSEIHSNFESIHFDVAEYELTRKFDLFTKPKSKYCSENCGQIAAQRRLKSMIRDQWILQETSNTSGLGTPMSIDDLSSTLDTAYTSRNYTPEQSIEPIDITTLSAPNSKKKTVAVSSPKGKLETNEPVIATMIITDKSEEMIKQEIMEIDQEILPPHAIGFLGEPSGFVHEKERLNELENLQSKERIVIERIKSILDYGKYLETYTAKVKQYNSIQKQSSVKSQICGFDPILVDSFGSLKVSDIIDVSDDQKDNKSEFDFPETVCRQPKKCRKHAGWEDLHLSKAETQMNIHLHRLKVLQYEMDALIENIKCTRENIRSVVDKVSQRSLTKYKTFQLEDSMTLFI